MHQRVLEDAASALFKTHDARIRATAPWFMPVCSRMTYTIVGFPSVDELIAYLTNKPGQPDESSDYGDDEDWIVP
jgi:hypothetical protein